MIKHILGTITTKLVSAFVGLTTILLTGWYLGAEKMGIVSLIILAITFIQMINSIVGGGAIVYLFPRTHLVKLVVPAYLWGILTSTLGTSVLHVLQKIPQGYGWDVYLLSLILSLSTVNYMVLMGQERIRAYNSSTLAQVLVFILVLCFGLFVLDQGQVVTYVRALYVSYLVAFVISFSAIMKGANWGGFKNLGSTLKELFRLGTIMQVGNVIQFFNYRLSYYFIEFFMGIRSVGIYTMGVQLSESLWLVGKSVHMVQYARISNENDENYAARLTLNLVKMTFLITLLTFFLLVGLLNILFPLIFKPEFAPVKTILSYLFVGILTFSVSIILSPYFSGLGKPLHNTISAAIGLLFTVVLGWILIPRMGYVGAAITASLSYTSATIYQFVVFIRFTKLHPRDFLLRWSDVRSMIVAFRSSVANK